MFQNRFDEFYLTICKEVGGIQGFIKSFFDFMIRKTDFFYQCDPGDKMGFPPGYSKQMLIGIFEQFQKEHYKKFPQKSAEDFNKRLEAYKTKSKNTQKNQQKPIEKQKEQAKIEKPSQPKKEQSKQEKTNVKPIINTYNGGNNEKYSWSQQIKQVEVTIPIEDNINSKNINVILKNDEVIITKKTGESIIQGKLYEKINAGQSVWKIQKSANKNFLVLNLEKAGQKIWSTVFQGDAEIDTTKVNNTKPLQDFDDQTQGAIRKIMYEQQRKQQGLPTTEEQKQIEALKKAWDAEGSPFKGKPFDPSLLNLSGNNHFIPQ